MLHFEIRKNSSILRVCLRFAINFGLVNHFKWSVEEIVSLFHHHCLSFNLELLPKVAIISFHYFIQIRENFVDPLIPSRRLLTIFHPADTFVPPKNVPNSCLFASQLSFFLLAAFILTLLNLVYS